MSEQKARRVNQERTSLATAIAGMKHWDWCPICRGGLDTGLECDQCGADLMPIYTAFKESLSGGNPGEPNACTGAEERGISGATGAGQHPDDNSESTGDSADRRSPGGHQSSPSPDESNRLPHEPGAWLPIETAPKDREILGWFTYHASPANGGSVFVMRWNEDAYAKRPQPHFQASGWVWGSRDQKKRQPTHWMPLPGRPPTKESSHEG